MSLKFNLIDAPILLRILRIMKMDSYKILGIFGFLILVAISLYLILRIIGVFHSVTIEEVLLAIVVGQVFYNGYTYKAIQEIEKSIKRLEERLKDRDYARID